jgi:hypothetical protein
VSAARTRLGTMHLHHERAGARMRCGLAVVLSLVLLGVVSGSAFGAQEWRVDSLSNTTVAAGGELTYYVQLMNTGDADMDGSQIDALATLDAGMTAVDARLDDPINGTTSCTAGDGVSPVAGAATVLCSTTAAVPAAIHSGGVSYLTMVVTVRADLSAAGTLMSSFQASGGGAGSASTVDPTRVSAVLPGFGVEAFDGVVSADASGAVLRQAGGHPYEATVSIDFNTVNNPKPMIGDLWPVEAVKDVFVDLPPGFVGDPTGADTCTAKELANSASTASLPLCPPTSQVGTGLLRISLGLTTPYGPVPVFNMVPPPDVPARFGFNVLGSVVVLDATLRSGGDYGLTVVARDVPQAVSLSGTSMTFWGVPADPSHDADRACPGESPPSLGGPSCRNGSPRTAFLRNPTSCSEGVGLTTTARVDSWTHPGVFREATWVTHDPAGYPFPPSVYGPQSGTTGCPDVPFNPTLTARPHTTRAGSPSGFSFDLTSPQTNDPALTAEADLRKAVVRLPLGVRVSPSSADGLGACAPGNIRLHDSTVPDCPLSSKVGSATIETPLLRVPLEGAIYLAKPNDNPFGSLLSIYLVAKGPGVVVKLAGKVEADPISGQLTTTFDDNPQLPFSNLHLEFKGGARAPLVIPKQCGTYTTEATLTSWSERTVVSTSSFTVSRDGNGAPCGPARFSPGFDAGTADPVAGKTSTFNLALTRDDEDQEFKAVTVNMPGGLTGKIANATLCGATDAAKGTCPEASKVGRVTVGAGAGTNPFYITTGRVYVTGPYKSAPYGLSIVVPAVAGPFDLGNVVVRSALFVDKHTADLSVVSDPLPSILQGIPLQVRDVRVSVDKPDFILNPTSCAEKTISGVVASTEGLSARVSDRFQVGECANLAFKPRMVMRVGGRGHTRRGQTSPFTTTLTMPQRGQANLRLVRVTLPLSINARLNTINDACTRAEFEADLRKCSHAIAGTAVASTPLLRAPLRGNVYFVKNGHPIPDLFVALRGQVSFDLIGRITIPGGKHLATTFATAPDVPIRSFTLRLLGAARTASIGAARNLCSTASRRLKAQVDYIAQNGRVRQVDQALKVAGCTKPNRGKKTPRHNTP